jgi:acyl-coenzyme A synthetase/AMP-(fatty) acid ligase
VVVLDQIDPDNQDWQATDQDKYKVIKWFDFITESENSVIPNEENFMSTDDVLIFWSSGTTGTPKGALYNFDMMARMIIYEKSVFLEDTIDIRCFVMTTNFFHAGGFTFALINGIKSVNTIIVFTSKEESSVITSEDLFQVCDTFKPTILKLGSHHAIQLGYNQPKYPNLDLTSLLYGKTETAWKKST